MYQNIYCTRQHSISGSYYTTPLRCARTCKQFPCEYFSEEQLQEYISQGWIIEIFTGFKTRRERMYLFRKNDGTIEEAPDSFDHQNPGWDDFKEVEEVLFVSKVLIPQIKLVPKPAQSTKQSKPARPEKEEKADKTEAKEKTTRKK